MTTLAEASTFDYTGNSCNCSTPVEVEQSDYNHGWKQADHDLNHAFCITVKQHGPVIGPFWTTLYGPVTYKEAGNQKGPY